MGTVRTWDAIAFVLSWLRTALSEVSAGKFQDPNCLFFAPGSLPFQQKEEHRHWGHAQLQSLSGCTPCIPGATSYGGMSSFIICHYLL